MDLILPDMEYLSYANLDRDWPLPDTEATAQELQLSSSFLLDQRPEDHADEMLNNYHGANSWQIDPILMNDLAFDDSAAHATTPAEMSSAPTPQPGDAMHPTGYSGTSDLVTSVTSTPGAQVKASRRARKAKSRGPSPTNWIAQKPNIQKLYIEDDLTLGETIKLMKDRHGFEATTQMYKDKFQEWGFMKNISHRVAGKLSRIADERKPKDTEFWLGPKRWTAYEIKRKLERNGKDETQAPDESPTLPNGLVWRTPKNTLIRCSPPIVPVARPRESSHPNSVVTHHHHHRGIRNQLPVIVDHRNMTPVVPRSPPGPLPPLQQWTISMNDFPPARSSSPRTNYPWNEPVHHPQDAARYPLIRPPAQRRRGERPGLSEVLKLRAEAVSPATKQNPEAAVSKLRTVVGEMQDIFSPTSDLTVECGYELAQVLGTTQNTEEATAVLDWIGVNLAKKYGNQHTKTIKHYATVADLLRQWSREEDARILMFKISEIWKDNTDEPLMIPGGASRDLLPTSLDEDDLRKLFAEPKEAADVTTQMHLVRVLGLSQKDVNVDLQGVLSNLISYCETSRLVPESLEARGILARYYLETVSQASALRALNTWLPRVERALAQKENHSPKLLKACCDLAFLYYNCEDLAKCEDVLELTTSSLESTYIPASHKGKMQSSQVVDFLILVAQEWQKRLSWEAAAPWVERAFANSVKILGRCHCKTRMLENSLDAGMLSMTGDNLISLELEGILCS